MGVDKQLSVEKPQLVKIVNETGDPCDTRFIDPETGDLLPFPWLKQARIMIRDGTCWLAVECQVPLVMMANIDSWQRKKIEYDPTSPVSIERAINYLKDEKRRLPQRECED